MAKEIKVEGKDLIDTQVRFDALNKMNNDLTTEELGKLKQMCSSKGRSTLKTKWNLIKSFI